MAAPGAAGLDDAGWMRQALALAALGEGATSPNPRVGCVLVRDGRVVGSGFHEAAGRPHAEARAAGAAGERARGATLYVNLEPCCHHGRTPPCTDLLIRSGIRRVVAAIVDPNPQVNGRGFEKLRDAGIAVEVGTLADEARLLNEPFLHWQRTGRPLVTLKAASSLDGRLAARGGASQWITGSAARRVAHRLRMRSDAILVGAGTVRRDDPRLTVRLAGSPAPRLRVVLAPGLDVPPTARVFDPDESRALPRVYAAPEGPSRAEEALRGRAVVVRVPAPAGRLDLHAVLSDLGGVGVQSVLVEGGGRTLAAFLESGAAHRVALFVAPSLLASRGGVALLEGEAAVAPDRGWVLERPTCSPLGEDLLVEARLAGALRAGE